MGFFDTDAGVDEYIKMAEGYDGAELIAVMAEHAPPCAGLLELGMGPGVDLDLLAAAGFDVTGSDASEVFVRRYQERDGKAPVLVLDARTIPTDERFDVVYSNKVLHHLTREELTQSLARQAELVEPGGILFHSFWRGEGEEGDQGLRFIHYTEETLEKRVPDTLELLVCDVYDEMGPEDSFWAVLRRPEGKVGSMPSS